MRDRRGCSGNVSPMVGERKNCHLRVPVCVCQGCLGGWAGEGGAGSRRTFGREKSVLYMHVDGKEGSKGGNRDTDTDQQTNSIRPPTAITHHKGRQ